MKNKKIVLAVLILVFVIGFILNVVFTNRKSLFFEKSIKDVFYFAENIISYPLKLINDSILKNKEKNKMYKEYEELKNIKDEYDNVLSLNNELKRQIEELKKLNDINFTLDNYTRINATVIYRDINYFNETIVIDKGTHDGVKNNAAVVVGSNFIGKVIDASFSTSTIRLLTANNSLDKISVRLSLDDNYVYGILNGYENNEFNIELLSLSNNITLDSEVTTTGLSSIFPSGLIIGHVTNIATDDFELANVLKVSPSIDFNNLNYVSVLIRGEE